MNQVAEYVSNELKPPSRLDMPVITGVFLFQPMFSFRCLSCEEIPEFHTSSMQVNHTVETDDTQPTKTWAPKIPSWIFLGGYYLVFRKRVRQWSTG